MSLPLQRAETTFYSFLIAIVSVFVVIGILLNILLHFIVIKPMINIAKQADKVSMGELEIAELNVKGNDEIASVGQSFNRMHRSLINAFSMLDDADK
jgi:protein-histidine pros-kinase